jgi:hypothetical protein
MKNSFAAYKCIVINKIFFLGKSSSLDVPFVQLSSDICMIVSSVADILNNSVF